MPPPCALAAAAAAADVYCDRRLPAEVRCHEVLLGECLGGALAVNDFVRLAQQVRAQLAVRCGILLCVHLDAPAAANDCLRLLPRG